MSLFDAMGPLSPFNSANRASSLGRPITFRKFIPTIWLPVRPVTPFSSPLTIKFARSASEAASPSGEFHPTTDRNPIYRILLDYGTDERSGTPLHPLQSLRQAMHQALYVHNRQRARSLSTIKRIFELYTALLGQGSLEPVDTLVIARLLHLTLLERQSASTATALSGYIGIFTSHYVTKALPPHSEASSQLLSIYGIKSEHVMGALLWEWMVHQGDRYVSTKTYARAILNAAGGNQPLRVCEELFEEALERYYDKDVSLILSPGIMLPHDLQGLKAVSIPFHLYAAICHARIREGDWRTAYLNLDTAFRVWPSTISCHFLKTVLKGRPIHEGYQVFSLFCQAGAYVRGKELHLLLNPLARACVDSVDSGLKLDLIKAMLEAIRSFLNNRDARLDGRHLNCLIRGFLSIIPHQGLGTRQEDSEMDTAITSFLSYLMGWYSERGSKPCTDIPITVISWSRKLRSTSLLEWALEKFGDMDQIVTLQSPWNNCSPANSPLYNSVLYAAGKLRSTEMVKTAWKCLARSLGGTRIGPQPGDWWTFAEAAKGTGLVPYYNSQLELFTSKGKIGALTARRAKYIYRSKPTNQLEQTMCAEAPDTRIAIEAFLQDARAILEDFGPASSKGAKDIPLISGSIWRWPAAVPEEWQRRLYDELSSKSSVELKANPIPYKGGKAHNCFGFSYRELRYRSWKTINNLLLQAEAFEHRKERLSESQDSTDCIQSIARSPRKHDGSARPHHLPWLLEHLDDITKESNKQYTEEEWREKILSLRSPHHSYPCPKQTV